jgi:hypothetical protein
MCLQDDEYLKKLDRLLVLCEVYDKILDKNKGCSLFYRMVIIIETAEVLDEIDKILNKNGNSGL